MMFSPVVRVIEEAVSFLSTADQLLQLCRVIDGSGSPKLALPVAQKAYDLQMTVRDKLRQRTELQATISLLEQERERYKRLKKDLPPEKLAELANLRQKLQAFEMPFSGSCNNSDINAMEQQALQIALVMLACLMDVKKNLTTKRGEVLQRAAILTKAEQEMANDPEKLSKMAQEVLSWAIPERVRDPAHMMQIAKNTELEYGTTTASTNCLSGTKRSLCLSLEDKSVSTFCTCRSKLRPTRRTRRDFKNYARCAKVC